MANANGPAMPAGYCYEFTVGGDWRGGPSDDWDTEIYTPAGGERKLGAKYIDGTLCAVFECPDGRLRAVTAASVR